MFKEVANIPQVPYWGTMMACGQSLLLGVGPLCVVVRPSEVFFFPQAVHQDWASLVAQLVKNLPAMLETLVRSLGWEDSLQKGKTTQSGILAWRIPWTVQSMGSQRVRHNFHFLSLHPDWVLESPQQVAGRDLLTCLGKKYSNRIKRAYALHKIKAVFVCEFFFLNAYTFVFLGFESLSFSCGNGTQGMEESPKYCLWSTS